LDAHSLALEETDSAPANLEDLTPRMDDADEQRNDDVSQPDRCLQPTSEYALTDPQDATTHSFALMSAEALEARCSELGRRVVDLKQEAYTNTFECQTHYSFWFTFNRRYIRLRDQLKNAPQHFVLNTDDPTYLVQATNLIALDTERAKSQAEMVRIMRRELVIFAELEQTYLELAKLEGVEDMPEIKEILEMLAGRIERQYEVRRHFGRRLLHHASGAGGI
jgi:hypothetical protein